MQFQNFDLNLLRSLDAFLTERNVTRAAERLFVTQQAMSASLRRLREHFDDELLVRVGRNFELTPLASALMEPVKTSLQSIQTALQVRPKFEPATEQRHFKVAMTDYAAMVLMPTVLRLLLESAPYTVIHVERLDADSYNRLERGDLDFCVGLIDWENHKIYKPSEHIRIEGLFRDDFVCVVDPVHFDAAADITLEQYVNARHGQVSFGSDWRTLIDRGWLRAGIEPRIVTKAPSFSSLIMMLPGTPLVATIHRRMAQAMAHALGLKIMECPITIRPLEESLVWLDRNDTDPGHCFIRDVFKEAGRKI
ncbi:MULTISPECIES: LysR family transcriptional regulator [unclassified Pseudomonas]|uniref:LysR family transcriptional regulator n=1 Tax=unclassified Pseudomonas TaxID=196821 RepID=UPI0021CA9C5E|nr:MULTISPECIES: LysR family transcriptional regulator [unclassified Pseudomonas]MCU1733623.1 LysR family transcriptional regulator [Pseudomonas sp. 20P_3.2_Bac4]MCU1743287.1 LysR family transcriptional regulator [Pseudomonas sp. 20P_3.2_Bac5]